METGTTVSAVEEVAVAKIRKSLDLIIAVPKDKDPEGRINVLSLAALMVESLFVSGVISKTPYDAFKAEIIKLADETSVI